MAGRHAIVFVYKDNKEEVTSDQVSNTEIQLIIYINNRYIYNNDIICIYVFCINI